MQTIAFNDARFNKYGRYVDDGVGTFLTWSGSWLRFKVSGTTQVQLVCQVNLTSGAAGALVANVDGGAYQTVAVTVPQADQEETVTLVSGLDSSEHEILVKVAEYITHSGLTTAEFLKIKAVLIDDGGTLSAWPQAGTKKVLVLGDSWCGSQNGYPERFDLSNWLVHCVGFGGFTSATLGTYYPWTAGAVAHTDPVCDAVLISTSVNDHNAGMTKAAFVANLRALILQVMADQPNVPIFLLRVPSNSAANSYGRFGQAMKYLAERIEGVEYIDTLEIEASLVWTVDNAHLDDAGRTLLGSFVSRKMYEFMAEPNVAFPALVDWTYDATKVDPTRVRLRLAHNRSAVAFCPFSWDGAEAEGRSVYLDRTTIAAPDVVEEVFATDLPYVDLTDSFISFAARDAFDINARNWKVGFKIEPDAAGIVVPLFQVGLHAAGITFLDVLRSPADKIQVSLYNGAAYVVQFVSADSFAGAVEAVLTRSGSDWTLYVNGTLQGSAVYAGSVSPASQTLDVGKYNDGGLFKLTGKVYYFYWEMDAESPDASVLPAPYDSGSPTSESGWISINGDSISDIVLIERGDKNALYQYAANNGAYNGADLTYSQLKDEFPIAITDKSNTFKLKVIHQSNGWQQSEVEPVGLVVDTLYSSVSGQRSQIGGKSEVFGG